MQHELNEGERLFTEGNIEEAEKIFLKILKQNPDSKEVLNNLGVTAFQQRKINEAADYFSRSIALDDCYLDAITNLCELLIAENDFEKAISLLQEPIKKNPQNKELQRLYTEASEIITLTRQEKILDKNEAIHAIKKTIRPDKRENMINLPENWIGPVGIGGFGGSGTRLLARLIKEAGFYTGMAFNESDDNLYFSNLFANPLRLLWTDNHEIEAPETEAQIVEAIGVFEKAMLCPDGLSEEDLLCVFRYAFELGTITHKKDARMPLIREWMSRLFLSMLSPKYIDYDKYLGWGWKDPCTFIYLKQLKACFPHMKYIHVIRHGLDMAFSANDWHLHHWGWLFGLEPPQKEQEYPSAQLRLWNLANRHTVRTAQEILGENFLLVRFEDVCLNTETTAKTILDFLGVVPDSNLLNEFIGMVIVPESLYRYKQKDINMFDSVDVDGIERFGYTI